MSFTLEELKGVPEDVISGYTKREEDGKTLYDVTYKTPDIFPLVRLHQMRQESAANPGLMNILVQIRRESRDSTEGLRGIRKSIGDQCSSPRQGPRSTP